MINIQVEKNDNENTPSLMRRFTKRVRGAGILPRVRSIRYYKRPLSKFMKKKGTLKSLKKRGELEELVKLGKITEDEMRNKKRRR